MSERDIRKQAIRILRRHAQEGKLFQAVGIREELGLAKNSPEAHYLHNYLGGLLRSGVVAVTGPSRKRNRYFQVTNETELHRRYGQLVTGGVRSTNGAGGGNETLRETPRTGRFVDQLHELSVKVDKLAVNVDELRDELTIKVDKLGDELTIKVDKLIDLWG